MDEQKFQAQYSFAIKVLLSSIVFMGLIGVLFKVAKWTINIVFG